MGPVFFDNFGGIIGGGICIVHGSLLIISYSLLVLIMDHGSWIIDH